MGLKERISALRKRVSGAAPKRAAKGSERRPRTPAKPTGGGDARKPASAATGAAVEVGKLLREMLVIPAQLFLAAAEIAGKATLTVWQRAVLPLLVKLGALVAVAYRLALRHVTPARAVTAVALVAIGALVASQWLDYRGISVGTDAYTGGLEAVAPAPEVERGRAGDAHAWLMLPLALASLVVLVLALVRRARLGHLLVPLGAIAILISVVVDAPKGLDEGSAAIAYQGAHATLLEGFWVQIAAGAVLIACGFLLPRYLTPARARARSPQRPGKGKTGRLGRLAERAGSKLRRDPSAKRGVEGART